MRNPMHAVLVAALAVVAFAPRVHAYSNGISTASFGVSGCNTCHSGGNDPIVTVSGPEYVRPQSVHEYRVKILPPPMTPQTAAGFNVSAADGTFTLGGKYLVQTLLVGSPAEVTHSSPKLASGGVATFSFLWQAPAAFSSTDLEAWGNAVNLSGNTAGDRASFSSMTVSNGELDLCPSSPPSCLVPGKSALAITDSDDDSKDAFSFQWGKGPALGGSDLGDPTVSSDWAVCIYQDAALVMELDMPAATACDGAPCWKVAGDALAPKGYKYKNKGATPSGVQSAKFAAGAVGKTKLQLKAKGVDLPDSLSLPVGGTAISVAVINSVNTSCLGVNYSPFDVLKDDGIKLKVKSSAP